MPAFNASVDGCGRFVGGAHLPNDKACLVMPAAGTDRICSGHGVKVVAKDLDLFFLHGFFNCIILILIGFGFQVTLAADEHAILWKHQRFAFGAEHCHYLTVL
jgi:hypothetical protein